jgi:hypothetical protein
MVREMKKILVRKIIIVYLCQRPDRKIPINLFLLEERTWALLPKPHQLTQHDRETQKNVLKPTVGPGDHLAVIVPASSVTISNFDFINWHLNRSM